MIRSLSIRGYRCFREFTAEGFARVNLLVGKNNAGKTALLEALHFQAAGADISVFNRAAFRRGEVVVLEDWEIDPSSQQPTVLADISRLFHGHNLYACPRIEFATDGMPSMTLSL